MHKRLPDRLKEAVTLLFPVTTPNFCGQNSAKTDSLVICIGKGVVGGTGLEPVTKAL